MYPSHYERSEFLSKEEGSHKKYVGIPAESYSTKKPEGNNKGNRNMNGQEPLCGEALHICSPIPEGDIQKKNKEAYEKKFRHAYFSKISILEAISRKCR